MSYKIAIIGGDGTGPEVVAESVKVLKAVQKLFGCEFDCETLPYSGERYIKENKTLSDEECEALKGYDAILLGAIGHPDIKPGIVERGILLKLRFGLDQYINLRPVKLYENVRSPIKDLQPGDIDYVVIRENTGGMYTGIGERKDIGTDHEFASQTMLYTRPQVERCLRFAFDYALKRHQQGPWKGLSESERSEGYVGKLTLVGKSNVLNYVFDLWEAVFSELESTYPKIKRDYCHVDAACIYMIENPQRFDVIVTTNMFGDIITDLAAVTQGGMGVAPGGNINPEGVSMFEPIGGTAPLFTGLNQINPMASIGSTQLMLAHLGEDKAAEALERAIVTTLKKMTSMQAGKMGFSTQEIGDMVVDAL